MRGSWPGHQCGPITSAMRFEGRHGGTAGLSGGRAGLVLAVALAGCVHQTDRPLALAPDLASDASQLSVDIGRIKLGALPAHPIDPARGIDPTDAAILAVLNSPDLAARRAAAGVADAQ